MTDATSHFALKHDTAAHPAEPAPGIETPAGEPEQDEFYQPPLLHPTGDRPNKNRPLVVLWDQTHEDDKRIAWPPDELFKLTCHPNVVLFHLHSVGDCSFRLHELWKKFRGVGWFVVPAGCQSTSCYGVGRPAIFTRSLHFLGLYQRGKLIAPAIVPGQIVDGGFLGVIRLVEAMWPKRQRQVLISSLEEAPPGWELYTRILPPMENYENPVLTSVVNSVSA